MTGPDFKINKTKKEMFMKFLVNWFDIPASDINRAVDFYNALFSLKLDIIDCGSEKMACFPEINGVAGAISQVEGFNPSSNGIQITFDGGDNLDELLDSVASLGGKVIKGKTKIEVEGRGYFAQVQDTEGNIIGVYSDN